MAALQDRLRKLIGNNQIKIKESNHYNKKEKSWMTREIMKEIRKRDKLLYQRRKETKVNKKIGT